MQDNEETKDVFIQVRVTRSKKAQIKSDARRLGYRNVSEFARDAMSYFTKMADRTR